MDADPAFPHKGVKRGSEEVESCTNCESPLTAPHLCEKCGYPQPLKGSPDYFEFLGAPRRFSQDRAALEKRFYEISRALHPDRFSGIGGEAVAASVQRMSALNEAYSTLKDPGKLRKYILEQEGISVPTETKAQIPMELAEDWFEIQEAVMEEPGAAGQKIEEFEALLSAQSKKDEDAIRSLERRYDESPEKSELEKMAKLLQKQSYLKSLSRDVEKLKEKFL